MREYLEKSNSQLKMEEIEIIMKCLSSDIENRYSSCDELLKVLSSVD